MIISLMACQDNALNETDAFNIKPTVDNDQPSDDDEGSSLRIYVMDARFSRTTCSTGPGVCFKDGSGNIWSYDFYVRPSGGDDVGTIGIELSGEKLHFTFFRSLEEDSFIVEEDVQMDGKIASALGKEILILKAGTYRVSYDHYKYGEAYADFVSK